MGEAPIGDEVLIFFLQLCPHLLYISGFVSGKGAYIAVIGSLSMDFGVLKHHLTGLSSLVGGAYILSIY